MPKNEVTICCWHCGHEALMLQTKKQEETLVRKISNLKAVCPECRDNDRGNQPIFIKDGTSVVGASKSFKCRHGHITNVSAFANGMLNVTFGNDYEDFFNVEGRIEDLEEMIDNKDISCHHTREDGKLCGCKLAPVDDAVLAYPNASNIKTKTRIGDIWDKNGVSPVRSGSYDKSGNYHGTESEKANKERLNKMRERNIAEDKHPGKRITKATKRNYGRKSKGQIDMS